MFGHPTTATTQSTGFSFGGSTAVSKPPLFGTTTNTSSAGTLFGSAGAAPTGGGLFGSKPATPAATGGLFGAQTSSAAATTPFFGATQTPAATGLFGATSTAATGAFGTTTSTAATSGFSLGNFGKTAANPPSLFGATTSAAAMTQAPAQVSAPPMPVVTLDAYTRALTSVQLYGDERDEVITNLNQLHAKAGTTAKGYHTASQQPLDFTPNNPFNRFQALVYNQIPRHSDSDGLLGLIIGQPAEKVSAQKQLIEDGLFKIMGNKPTLKAHVESVRKLPNDQCDVTMYVTEQSATGVHRRIAASECNAFLQQQAQQLQTQLNVLNVYPKIGMDENKLHEYLAAIPAGITPLVWKQVKAENPDASRLIPWPVRGFKELHERHTMQQQQAQQQNDQLTALSSSCSKMSEKANVMQTRCMQMKAKQDQLTHRLLKVMACQFERARIGRAFTVEEEQLYNKLDLMLALISSPAGNRARLTELNSIVRCQPELLSGSAAPSTNTTVDELDDMRDESEEKMVQEELHRMMRKCHDRIESMLQCVSADMKTMKQMQNIISSQQ